MTQNERLAELGFGPAQLVAGPGSRYVASCKTCGVMVLVPTNADDDPKSARLHKGFMHPEGQDA